MGYLMVLFKCYCSPMDPRYKYIKFIYSFLNIVRYIIHQIFFTSWQLRKKKGVVPFSLATQHNITEKSTTQAVEHLASLGTIMLRPGMSRCYRTRLCKKGNSTSIGCYQLASMAKQPSLNIQYNLGMQAPSLEFFCDCK